MIAAAVGSLLLGLTLLAAGVAPLLKLPSDTLTRILALGSALAYVAAFAPPALLVRAWQEPLLRTFVQSATAVSPTAEQVLILRQLEGAVALAMGGVSAEIDLSGALRAAELRSSTGRSGDAVLVAPRAARGRDIGVLSVRMRRTPIFAADDLARLQLLADQAAIVIDASRLYAELTAVNQQVAEATRVKTQFLANMSHELRTPLNAILGFSELLEDQLGDALQQRQKRYLHNIHEAGQHLLELVNEVLDLSKVEAGRVDLRPETLRVQTLVEPAIASARTAAGARGILVETDVSGERSVNLDAGRVRQVLYNLLSNAVKFTPSGGRVRLRVQVEGTALHIEVEDNGIGIPRSEHGRVFGTFERLHEGKSDASGTGLGLALTKKLVELHGGSITFESDEGQGTTFRVVLPDCVVEPVVGDRLLVVDDERADAALIVAVASELGLRTEVVGSAASAIDVIRRDPPIAVVLDLRLRDERGERVLEAMKADPATRAIPVIVVSVEDDEGWSRPLGAHDHMTKPVDRQRLLSWLRRIQRQAEVAHAPAAR